MKTYLRNIGAAFLGRQSPKAEAFDLANMTGDDLRDFLRIGGSAESATGIAINDRSALKVATAWRCIALISGTVSTTPLDLILRESEAIRRPAAGHPLRRVLTVKPNQWQTPKEFRQMLQVHLLLRGNAYARKVHVGRRIVGLIPLMPDRVTPRQLDDFRMEYEVRVKGGRSVIVPQNEMLHLRGMSLDGVTGLSVLHYMREALALSLQGEGASSEVMRRGSFVDGTLNTEHQLSDESFDKLKASWEEYKGAGNAGKTPILEDGLTYNPVGMSATDMQFLEGRDFQRYDVAMFYGVPPHMVGALSKTTSWGSGLEQQSIGFVTYTLMDWFKIWEESLKRDAISPSEWESHDVRFFPQALMRGDSKARKEYYQSMLQWGVLSPDEVRSLEDMNPRKDGDGGVYYDPPNTAGGTSDSTVPIEPTNPEDEQ